MELLSARIKPSKEYTKEASGKSRAFFFIISGEDNGYVYVAVPRQVNLAGSGFTLKLFCIAKK
jgi:hypothetical protein